MKVRVPVYTSDGSIVREVELPAVFSTPLRPDVVRKAVNSIQSNRRQPYGSDPLAGKRHSQYSVRSGYGISRIPRLSQGNRAVLAPSVVGGRRAHPPRVEKIWREKINRKEMRLAVESALAATARAEVVRSRGHRVPDGLALPVVLDSSFRTISKTKGAREVLEKIGLGEDLRRCEEGIHTRAGRGKMRGRRYRTPVGPLVVLVTTDTPFYRSLRSIVGVDGKAVTRLNAEDLAPGGEMGRLLVIEEEALALLGGIR